MKLTRSLAEELLDRLDLRRGIVRTTRDVVAERPLKPWQVALVAALRMSPYERRKALED